MAAGSRLVAVGARPLEVGVLRLPQYGVRSELVDEPPSQHGQEDFALVIVPATTRSAGGCRFTSVKSYSSAIVSLTSLLC